MNTLPDHQTIEDAYKTVQEVLAKLPDCTEARSARRNLDIAEKLTYEVRERAKADDRVAPAEMRDRG
jgi:hypothetical protein